MDSVRRRQPRGGSAGSRPERDDSFDREIERAHAMRVGEPLEHPSQQ